MIKSKLVRIFNALSRKELNEFGRYLKTSFFNRNDKPLRLYEYLKKYSNHDTRLSKEFVYDRIFPEINFDIRRLQEAMTDTSLLLQDYLTFYEIRNSKMDKQYLLLKAFRTRNLDSDYLELLDRMEKELEQSQARDMYYYFHKQRLYHCRYQNPNIYQPNEESGCIEQVMLNLDLCYAMAKLKFTYELRLRSLLQNQPFPSQAIPLMADIKNLVQTQWQQLNPLFEIYLHAFDFIEQIEKNQPQKKTYERLKTLIFHHLALASEEEQRSLVVGVIECAGLAAYHDESYLKECLEWYQFGLDNETIFEEGCIAHTHFVNMVILGSELGLPDWLKRLREDYVRFVREDFQLTSQRIADAFFLFTQRQFNDIPNLMRQVRFKNIIFKLQQRTLIIRSLYELGDSEEVDRLCENFRIFLMRSRFKLADEVINANENFIKIVKRLISPEKMNPTELHHELQAADRVVCRLWLAEKITGK